MSRFMRVLEKAGLVQLDEAESLVEARTLDGDVGSTAAGAGSVDKANAPGERIAHAVVAPPPASGQTDAAAIGISEQRPLSEIYLDQSVPPSPFPAEKLLKILDGLAALEPASRQAAVLALDAADDAWSIDDALLDAQNKIKALQDARLQIEDQTRAALALARSRIEAREQRQQEAVAAIRKQIADLEALLEREVARAAEEKAGLNNDAVAAKAACARETTRLAAEIERIGHIEAVFTPASAASSRSA